MIEKHKMPPVERFVAVDAVRGFAVLGILLMNIVSMGMPGYAYVDPSYFGGDEGADLFAWTVNYILVDGKMRALFTMLFGASMLLIADRAEGTPLGAGQTHYRRMAWLLLFGLLHGWFLWYGDILHSYAIAGLVVFLLRDQRPRLQVGLGIGALVLLAALGAYEHVHLDWLRSAARSPGASAEAVEAWRTASAQLAPSPARAQVELNGYRGTFLDALAVRVPTVSVVQTYFLLRYGLMEAFGYMLIGMALFRLGFLTGQWSSRAYFRFALTAYLVCVPLYLPIVDRLIDSSFDPVTIVATDVLVLPLQALMALAHAALVIWLIKQGMARSLLARLAAVGRMALSNYLGATLVCTTLFYGYGFGLFGRLGRAELYIVVAGVWALQLAWSKPWLGRFHYGPFEWLWRSLVRWSPQPFRKCRRSAGVQA